MTLLHLNVQLRTEVCRQRERCHKPAVLTDRLTVASPTVSEHGGVPGESLRAGSGVVKIELLRFLAGCCTRRLNQTLSILSLSLGFLNVFVVLLTRATF